MSHKSNIYQLRLRSPLNYKTSETFVFGYKSMRSGLTFFSTFSAFILSVR